MTKSPDGYKIGLLGPFGGGNLGDAAIQQAMIQNIRKRMPEAKIYGFSMFPQDTEERHGIPSFSIGRTPDSSWRPDTPLVRYIIQLAEKMSASSKPILRRSSRWIARAPLELSLVQKALKNLKDFDILIISGGGQLDDYWGGPWSHPYTLLKFAMAAKTRGAKVYIVSVGAGPIDSALSKVFIRKLLKISNYRSFRDEDSKRLIQSIGFDRDDPVCPDLAHSLPVDSYLERPRRVSAGPVVGVGPMAYYDPRVWPKKNQAVYMDYLAKLVEFTAWLVERGNHIVLFPGEAAHDRDVICDFLELSAKMGLDGRDHITVPVINTVDQLMHTMAGLDLVVASRFHGVLLPMLLEKPVLAASYHPKIDMLMEDTGQAEYCLPIDRFTVAELQARFVKLEANRERSRTAIHDQIENYRQALDRQYDTIFSRP